MHHHLLTSQEFCGVLRYNVLVPISMILNTMSYHLYLP